MHKCTLKHAGLVARHSINLGATQTEGSRPSCYSVAYCVSVSALASRSGPCKEHHMPVDLGVLATNPPLVQMWRTSAFMPRVSTYLRANNAQEAACKGLWRVYPGERG